MFGHIYGELHRYWAGSRKARQRVIGAAIGSLALLLGLISIPTSSAGAAPKAPYKYYTVKANPLTIYVGAATPVTIQLTNSGTSNQSFGSAEVTFGGLPATAVSQIGLPSGWNETPISSAPSASYMLTNATGAAIAPGSALSMDVTLQPTAAGSIPVTTAVKQSNDFSGTGNNFTLQGEDPTITAVGAASLSFHQQPTNVQQSTAKGSSYMCPLVKVLVTASDPVSGDPVPLSGVKVNLSAIPITLSDGSKVYPGLEFGSSSATEYSDATGVATFGSETAGGTCTSGVAATNLGAGFKLAATSPAAANAATSQPFSVVQFLQECDVSCSTTYPLTSTQNGTTGSIAASNGPPSYQLLASFGLGELLCDKDVTTSAGDPIVVQTTGGASGTVTMVFPKAVVNSLANNGTPLMQVCAGAKTPFLAADQVPLPGQTYPYQGLVPDCPNGYPTGDPAICVVSRSKKAASETIVINVSNLIDPSFW